MSWKKSARMHHSSVLEADVEHARFVEPQGAGLAWLTPHTACSPLDYQNCLLIENTLPCLGCE